mmetsp:Transcript_16006/g.20054  ORF Transcript_16006/g.20054 Transcript_16006/m.20054 type:complete len:233 (+) Transcript_16006:85-783(+)
MSKSCADSIGESLAYLVLRLTLFFDKVEGLAYACRKDDLFKDVRNLVDADSSLVHQRDSRGRTPLHHAAWHGADKVAHFLILMNAELDCLDCNGKTPLMLAAWAGNFSIVERLVDAGADTTLKDRLNCVAGERFHHSVPEKAQKKILQYLLKDSRLTEKSSPTEQEPPPQDNNSSVKRKHNGERGVQIIQHHCQGGPSLQKQKGERMLSVEEKVAINKDETVAQFDNGVEGF